MYKSQIRLVSFAYFYCVCLITVCRIYFLLPHKIGEIKLYINRPIVFARWRQYASLSKHSSWARTSLTPNRVLIGSAALAMLTTAMTNKETGPQTDHATPYVAISRIYAITRCRHGGGETICPHRWQFNPKIAADPMSVRGHLWWPAVAKLQAASVPIV